MLRSALLWASQSPRMERITRSSRPMRPLVRRFMPGETIDEALAAIRRLRQEDTPVIITYLGENVSTDAAADETVAEYVKLFAALQEFGDGAHVSIKLTQFGWDVDQGRALERVRHMARLAAANNTVLAIDIESSPYVESTVTGYERLAQEFSNVALCLQAYLHRTADDVKRLLPVRPYIRLVKGAYREPASVALQTKSEIDRNYEELAKTLLAGMGKGVRVVFGTHDVPLVNRIVHHARQLGIQDSAFEIQMLYGIQDGGRRALAAKGLKTRVLISYGKAWYPWFMRRLAEKPSNLLMVARNLFG